MTIASELVSGLRTESRLSQRAFAARAGCTRSTVVRIEAGETDVTLTMLSRLAAAAGRRLAIATPKTEGINLAELAEASSDINEVDWTPLRALVDWLREHPENVSRAISDPPARTGDAALDNLFAAIAEKAADDANLPRPRWTTALPPLPSPWRPPGTPRMRAEEEASAAPQFRERNLLLGEQNLWRETQLA